VTLSHPGLCVPPREDGGYNRDMTATASRAAVPEPELRFEREGPAYVLVTRQFLPLPQEQVFRFFEDPRNLARITPPWLSFRIKDPEAVEMKLGAQIEYTIRWMGLGMGWTTVISGYRPPTYFEDTQLRGPYAQWVHQHRFREADGGTWVEDRVLYRLPLGPLGHLAHRLGVQRQLREIFTYRAEQIAVLLPAE